MTQRLPVGSVPRHEPTRPVRYSLTDLETETGVTARNIRYYITEGLLQPAYGRGPSATYDADHLLRLKLIQQLKEQHLPLREIREKLSDLTAEDVARMMSVQLKPDIENWRRYLLADDVHLMVRESDMGFSDVDEAQAITMIVDYARSVLDDLYELKRGRR